MDTTPLILKARTPGNRWGYDRLFDLSRVREAYKRCRKMQSFILEDSYLRANRVCCSHPECGLRILPDDMQDDTRLHGNRGHYHPRSGRVEVMHYTCAWTGILQVIARG